MRTAALLPCLLLCACSGSVDSVPSADAGASQPDATSEASDDAASDATDESSEETGSDAAGSDGGLPPDFMDPVAADALLIELKGLINTEDAANDPMQTTYAKAPQFEAVLASGTIEMPDSPLAASYQYPDDDSVPEDLRGLEVVLVQAHREDPAPTQAHGRARTGSSRSSATDREDPASTQAHGKYVLGRVIVDREVFQGLVNAGENSLGIDDIRSAYVQEIDIVVREDTANLSKYCYLGVADRDNEDSAMYVDTSDNTEFASGEVLTAWANIGLLTDPGDMVEQAVGYEVHEGKRCLCLMNGSGIPCADWEEETIKTGTELSCQVPSDFFDDPAESHETFVFKGQISELGDVQGAGTWDVVYDGTSVPIDYMSYATRSTVTSGAYAGEPLLDIVGLGNVQPTGPGRYTMNYVDAQVLVNGLEDLKSTGEHQMNLDAQHIYFGFLHEIELVPGPPEFLKYCPKAVMDSYATPSALYVCHENNTSFDVAETLEIAGNLPFTTDPAAIAQLTGGEECFCTEDGVAMDCADFPAP